MPAATADPVVASDPAETRTIDLGVFSLPGSAPRVSALGGLVWDRSGLSIAQQGEYWTAGVVGVWTAAGSDTVIEVSAMGSPILPLEWVGRKVTVELRATAAGWSGSRTLVSDWVLAPATFPKNNLTVRGQVRADEPMWVFATVRPEFWAESGLTYRWLIDGALRGTAAEYTPRAADVGKQVRVEVSASRPGYQRAVFTLTRSALVAPSTRPQTEVPPVVEEPKPTVTPPPVVVPKPRVSMPKKVRSGRNFTVTITHLAKGKRVQVMASHTRMPNQGFIRVKASGTLMVVVPRVKLLKGKKKRTVTVTVHAGRTDRTARVRVTH